MTIYGKDGFPVELIEGKPIVNFLRLLIHSNIRMTIRKRAQ